MEKLTTHELPIAGKGGIKNYQNMSREKLSSTLDELERKLKIYHKMDLSNLQECRIFYRTILSKSQK